MTSMMQYFGKSLNNISKFRRHEKANKIRRRIFELVVVIPIDSWSDDEDDGDADVETENFKF